MGHITLTPADVRPLDRTGAAAEDRRRRALRQALLHPIRVRIIEILRGSDAMTQRELGKSLFLSNAAVHHHLQTLLAVHLVKLQGTRPGPNGITEKLYATDQNEWQAALAEPTNEVNFYLQYTLAWIHERHREGVETLRSEGFAFPFLAGSYVVHLPPSAAVEFKRDLQKRCMRLFEKHQKGSSRKTVPFTVTFAIMPSRITETKESRNILEHEPPEVKSLKRRGSP
ncbi:MAG: winged helix-turn-helix transcriptional regulator [Acidobacteriota bacterium]